MTKREQIIAWLSEIEAAMPERPKHLTDFKRGQTVFNSAGNEYKVTSFDGVVLRATEVASKLRYNFRSEAEGLFVYKTPHSYHSSKYVFFADKDASTNINKRYKAMRLIDDVYSSIEVYKRIEKSELTKS